MSQSVSVLLLDDGELDDFQVLLESMRIPFGRVRGASIVPGMQGPSHLLISTPRRIDAVKFVRDDRMEGNEPVRIMVTSEDSNSLRAQLRNVGFDYLVPSCRGGLRRHLQERADPPTGNARRPLDARL